MAVGVESDTDGNVAQCLGDDLQVDSLLQESSREGVPQVVQPHSGDLPRQRYHLKGWDLVDRPSRRSWARRELQVECAAALEYPWAMNRGTGTGLIAFGVVLGVVGAVMAFAVTVRTRGFNINTAGWILLVVGIIVLLIGIAILVTGSRRSSTTVENVQNTPSGQERVEERRDWGTP